ncbi:clathrin light chain B isoform X2 [Octopus bimaculoides]|uniref:clathrin light chain B isoform X2 n=1 Tax=Octopus bimaculoides TaxID=37653 RepID=UPI00071C3A47|nr:clathrin light chain B isoform X2 [Octopus bimaculoides]|eukprot:XP_014774092.1 PREDICTED: clathrin light chain B-like isoform X2 [Octopus bimaculoides]
MADFENFESAGDGNVEEDPAADFLAREQTELAGLEDDNFPVADASQPTAGLEDDNPPVEDVTLPTTADGFNTFEESNATVNGLSDADVPQTNGPTDGSGYAAIAQVDKHHREPEKIKLWREEQKKRLEHKDAEEENKKEIWREAAKKELEDWLKNQAEQLIKTKENNRHAEALEKKKAQEEASMKDREESIAGQEWEKICRLCDFNPKHSKNTKDVSRMRSILLQLKQTPLVR